MAEIDEGDLQALNHIKDVADAIMANPGTRTQFLRLAKAANPRLAIPEVDAAAPIINEVQQLGKRFDDYVTAREKADREAAENRAVEQFKARWASAEADLRQRGWMPTGIEEVKKFAEANGIADLTIAADAYERRNPQPTPMGSATSWNIFADQQAEDTFVPDMMKSKGDSDARLDQEIRATLAEIRSAQ